MTRNIEMLVRVARGLGDLRPEVVFVGGAVVELFVTDPAAPRPRFTEDVDVVVEITTRAEWSRLGERLRSRGFREDRREGAPICRWMLGDQGGGVQVARGRRLCREPGYRGYRGGRRWPTGNHHGDGRLAARASTLPGRDGRGLACECPIPRGPSWPPPWRLRPSSVAFGRSRTADSLPCAPPVPRPCITGRDGPERRRRGTASREVTARPAMGHSLTV